jgi:hypothetical protein
MHSTPIYEIRIAVSAMTGLAGCSEFLRFQEAVQVVRTISARALDLEWF